MAITPLTSKFLSSLLAAPNGPASLPWRSDGSHSFALSGRTGPVKVSNEGRGEHPYTLRVYSPSGDLIEEAQTVPAGHYVPWERQIEALYVDARSAALKLPEVLEGLIREFELPPEPPAEESDDIPF